MMRAAWARYKYKVLTRDIDVLTMLAIVAIHQQSCLPDGHR